MIQANVRVWTMPTLLCVTALASGVVDDMTDRAAHHIEARPSAQSVRHVERDTVLMSGRVRSFRVSVPTAVARGRPPLLAFHDGGSDGGRFHRLIGHRLDALADAHGFLVIYPDGFERGWNGCRSHASYLANRLSVDDVAFVRRLLRWAKEKYGTDGERALAIGYADGGHLVYRLALEAPQLLAAGSVFAANLPAAEALDCRPSAAPVTMMIVNGTADRITPYTGGNVVLPDGRRLGRVRSALDTARYFATLAGSTTTAPKRERLLPPSPAHGLWVDTRRWSGTHPVRLYTVHGGGHTIPGISVALMPLYVGRVERRFDAIGESVRFFVDQD